MPNKQLEWFFVKSKKLINAHALWIPWNRLKLMAGSILYIFDLEKLIYDFNFFLVKNVNLGRVFDCHQ